MDVLAVTDFPDIRFKCAIHSANHGNILIIPREGGYLSGFYIELDDVSDREPLENRQRHAGEADGGRQSDPASVHARGQGHRLVVGLRDRPATLRQVRRRAGARCRMRLPRVFIAGDACHTHSAKAGQGMNVSMADAWNLGWKLAAVLRGTARPELLHTYSEERQAVAQELIDFDREFAADAQRPAEGSGTRTAGRRPGGVPALLRRSRAASRRASRPRTRRR